MAIKTREELEQELEDIKSRLSVVETAQTQKKDVDSSNEQEEKKEKEDEPEVESEDEIEKLLNS